MQVSVLLKRQPAAFSQEIHLILPLSKVCSFYTSRLGSAEEAKELIREAMNRADQNNA